MTYMNYFLIIDTNVSNVMKNFESRIQNISPSRIFFFFKLDITDICSSKCCNSIIVIYYFLINMKNNSNGHDNFTFPMYIVFGFNFMPHSCGCFDYQFVSSWLSYKMHCFGMKPLECFLEVISIKQKLTIPEQIQKTTDKETLHKYLQGWIYY